MTGFIIRWACRLLGHDWKAEYEWYPGAGSRYEGDICRRCWRWRS